MKQDSSSRLPIIDIVECIGELIATQSHIAELYTSKVSELDTYILGNDESDYDEEYMDKITKDNERLREEYESLYRRRKEYMRLIKENYDVDMDYWCLLKHSIAVYQFSKEVRDTNRNNEMYEELFLQASEYMYKILSLFLGTDIVKCGRCLLDAMEEKEDGKLSTEN